MRLLRKWENVTVSRSQLWENLLNKACSDRAVESAISLYLFVCGKRTSGFLDHEHGHLEHYPQSKFTLFSISIPDGAFS